MDSVDKIKRLVFTNEFAFVKMGNNSSTESFFKLNVFMADGSACTLYSKKMARSEKRLYVEKQYDKNGNEILKQELSATECGSKMLDMIERYSDQGSKFAVFGSAIIKKRLLEEKHATAKELNRSMKSLVDIMNNNNVIEVFPGISDKGIGNRYRNLKNKLEVYPPSAIDSLESVMQMQWQRVKTLIKKVIGHNK